MVTDTNNSNAIATHGGLRPGAGRPPKALKYVDETDAIDRRIVDALPEIIDTAIALAKQGNVAAMRFLTERVLGRARSVDPISRDTALPYTQEDFEFDLTQKKNRRVAAKSAPAKSPLASIEDEIQTLFRRNDRPTVLDDLAANLIPRRKEPSLIAIAR
jgi:hypothetical protein